MTTIPIATGYRRAIFDSLILQVVLGILAMMVLDGGRRADVFVDRRIPAGGGAE